MHERGAEPDHQPAQDHRGENAPDENAVLRRAGNTQGGENDCNDEDVVHGQRLLDHEAGHVFLSGLCPEIPPDPTAEGEAEAEIERGEKEALLHPDLVVLVPM